MRFGLKVCTYTLFNPQEAIRRYQKQDEMSPSAAKAGPVCKDLRTR